MAADINSTLDTLAVVIQVIGKDRKLRQWFSGLAIKSAVERRNEVYAMIVRMTQQGEDAKIVASLNLIANENIFEAASRALSEYGQI